MTSLNTSLEDEKISKQPGEAHVFALQKQRHLSSLLSEVKVTVHSIVVCKAGEAAGVLPLMTWMCHVIRCMKRCVRAPESCSQTTSTWLGEHDCKPKIYSGDSQSSPDSTISVHQPHQDTTMIWKSAPLAICAFDWHLWWISSCPDSQTSPQGFKYAAGDLKFQPLCVMGFSGATVKILDVILYSLYLQFWPFFFFPITSYTSNQVIRWDI